ncbi:MAG: 16S rRNA (cytosine(967)-C(5))-methyltransferase RsmB, partial [Clostridia bacterium]|nr:16S rRNA (cytosine(967)-C(5))-methyltransferase RsmB [Clostridia bacterium]
NDKYITLSLSAALDVNELDVRDKALLTQIVYGVTERRVTLDYYISKLSDRPLEKIGARLLMILRIGMYQLMFLDRIPPHAAVSQTVRLGKSEGERAFVNGILRGYERKKADGIDLPKERIDFLSVKHSFPRGVVELIDKNYGERTEDILENLSKHPQMTICVNTLVKGVDDVKEMLDGLGISTSKTDAPRALHFGGNVTYDTLVNSIGENAFFVQDEASQLAITVLSPKKGDVVADVCACPGSKSFHAALIMENVGEIHCFDIHESKLSLIESGAKRLGIDIIKTSARDSRVADESLIGKCDCVICDVPCSGLGVMAKKPEIRYHNPEQYKELSALGYEILTASADYLKAGGKMLYSTCTLTKEENEYNFYRFLDEHKNFEYIDFSLGDAVSERGCVTLFPSGKHDGFFIGLLRKKD